MTSLITLYPVGRVEMKNDRHYLSIDKKYRKALTELEGFSHINVIWWGDQTDTPKSRDTVVTEKPYVSGPETVGIFATRSEYRPNPVLITTAEVIAVDHEKCIIDIGWIDAEKGTPVIDIKPYQPCSDRVKDVQLPEWCSQWPDCLEDSAAFDWASVFNG